MKYLLWLVCLFRGHIWTNETIGMVDDMRCKRHRCERCEMHRFEKLPAGDSLFG